MQHLNLTSLLVLPRRHSRAILLVLGGLTLIFLLLWLRLSTLTYNQAAPIEVVSRQAAASWHTIFLHPLNAPYTISQHILLMFGQSSLTAARLVSTVWALAGIGLFYIVARQWHSTRVAYLATWLLISSSWFLHTARLATPEVMWLVGPLATIVLFSPRTKLQRTWIAAPLAAISVAALLYIPGMIWIVALTVYLQRTSVMSVLLASRYWWLQIASSLGCIVLLSPLLYRLATSFDTLQQWLGLEHMQLHPFTIANHLLDVPQNLFVYAKLDPVHWLGHMPLLSSFETVMAGLGIAFYIRHVRTDRTRLLASVAAVAVLIIGIGNSVSLSLIVPLVYLVMASGIAYLLRQWLKVFPYNPLARSFGIMLVSLVITLTSLYQTRSYFVAWRYSAATDTAFNQELR